jgi:hypothetical protein
LTIPRILLAGIAKDEAAWLPEWIAHHLFMGFAGVALYINNTSDNSIEILDRIRRHYPQVSYRTDARGETYAMAGTESLIRDSYLRDSRLQACATVGQYLLAGQQGYSHVSFLDIDEFFVAPGFRDAPDFVARHCSADLFALRWFNESGRETPFMPALRDTIHGARAQGRASIKNIVRTGLDQISFHNQHIIQLPDNRRIYGAAIYRDSMNMPAPEREAMPAPAWNPDAWILHCMHRSEPEYLASLIRGNPDIWNTANQLKRNRSGWSRAYPHVFRPDPAWLQRRQTFVDQLVNTCELAAPLEKARASVLARAQACRNLVAEAQVLNLQMQKILQGTGMSPILPRPILPGPSVETLLTVAEDLCHRAPDISQMILRLLGQLSTYPPVRYRLARLQEQLQATESA